MALWTEMPSETWNDGILEYWVFKKISSFPYSNIPLFRHLFSKVRILGSAGLTTPEVFWAPMIWDKEIKPAGKRELSGLIGFVF